MTPIDHAKLVFPKQVLLLCGADSLCSWRLCVRPLPASLSSSHLLMTVLCQLRALNQLNRPYFPQAGTIHLPGIECPVNCERYVQANHIWRQIICLVLNAQSTVNATSRQITFEDRQANQWIPSFEHAGRGLGKKGAERLQKTETRKAEYLADGQSYKAIVWPNWDMKDWTSDNSGSSAEGGFAFWQPTTTQMNNRKQNHTILLQFWNSKH